MKAYYPRSGEVERIARSIGRYDPDTCRQAQVECWPERFLKPENVGDGASEHGAPIFRCMDDVEIEDIDWLWRGFLAGGKLAMFSGDPGTGKSTISVDLAARISTGADWPDGSPGCRSGSVILLGKEDAPEDIAPADYLGDDWDRQPDESAECAPTASPEILKREAILGGIPKRDTQGRTVDVHCLRHTFATLLARNGVSPGVAQKLMRHSDIRLTMNTYTHLDLADTAGAVAALPAI